MILRRVIRRAAGADVLECGHEARQRRPLAYACPCCLGRPTRQVLEHLVEEDVLECSHRVPVPRAMLERSRRRCRVCERAPASRQIGLFAGPR